MSFDYQTPYSEESSGAADSAIRSPAADESRTPADGPSIIVIGTSAGGVDALTRLIPALESDIPAAIFIVQHFPPTSRSVLADILRRAGRLPAHDARHGERIVAGQIYVAPNNRHLLITPGRVALSVAPPENRCRPAVDPLFRTAARSYGSRVVGVVLTGNLNDGTAGLQAIKAAGGVAVVQDPEDASYPGMPRSAVENVDVDHIVPLSAMAELLQRLVRDTAAGAAGETCEPAAALDEIMADYPDVRSAADAGNPPFSCPECRGSTAQIQNGGATAFPSHVGRIFSPESLADHQGEMREQALWTALAALEESVELSSRMAERARKQGRFVSASQFDKQALDNSRRAALLREALYRDMGTAAPDAAGGK